MTSHIDGMGGWVYYRIGSETYLGHHLLKAYHQALLNFTTKFWWAIVHSSIQLMLADNILIPLCAVLVANILVGNDIDWAHLIAE